MPKRRTCQSKVRKRTKTALRRRRNAVNDSESNAKVTDFNEIDGDIASNLSIEEKSNPNGTETPQHDLTNFETSYLETNESEIDGDLASNLSIDEKSNPNGTETPHHDLTNFETPYLETNESEDLPDLIVEFDSEAHEKSRPTNVFQGRRVTNLAYFMEQYDIVAQHFKSCTGGRMQLKKEIRRGLFSTLIFQCEWCNRTEAVNTDPPGENVNVALAWGATAIGIGYTQAEEMFAVLDVAVPTSRNYRKYEQKVGQVWSQKLAEKMEVAILEEKNIAEQKGHIECGHPYITVIVDGGWGKRSYGHGYSANSGLACIIGFHTGKLLYLGVKNKFCYCCSIRKPGEEVTNHVCNRNYVGPSTGMEQTIIVEGLNILYQKHGVWVKYLIGDGDSSVYARVRERAPFGPRTIKLECANHITRSFTSKLHALLLNTKYDLTGRKLLRTVIPRLTAAVRGAIKQNSDGNVGQLRADLRNGPHHVFGDHTACRSEFCKRDGKELNNVPLLKQCGLMQAIEGFVDVVVKKADRLVANRTTNSAENLMSLVSKFVGGKRVDFSKSESYQRRCFGAGLAQLSGPDYMLSPWRMVTNRSPGEHTKSILGRRKAKIVRARRLRFEKHARRTSAKKRKRMAPPDSEYGPDAAQTDISDEELNKAKDRTLLALQKEVETETDSQRLEQDTLGQHENLRWHEARRERITASMFGRVYSRKDSTPCHNLVKNMILKPEIYSKAVQYGRVNERKAISLYEEKFHVIVKACGLFVRPDIPFLGASPDGIVDDHGLVEVKCLPSLGNIPLREAAADPKLGRKLCIKLDNGELKLKNNHSYWAQIQGQLALTRRKWCDLLLYSDSGLEVVRILEDEQYWCSLLERLERFYMDCFLPELADSRIQRGMTVREPTYILEAQSAAKRIKGEKNKKKLKS